VVDARCDDRGRFVVVDSLGLVLEKRLGRAPVREPACRTACSGIWAATRTPLAAGSPTAAATSGALYAYDNWVISRNFSVAYGAKYARYDYLRDRGQFSPRASFTITPDADPHLKVHATVSRRALAPGAEEFLPPATGPVAAAGTDVLAGVRQERIHARAR
jgi:outer membrane receptor protein involved in Fe transport